MQIRGVAAARSRSRALPELRSHLVRQEDPSSSASASAVASALLRDTLIPVPADFLSAGEGVTLPAVLPHLPRPPPQVWVYIVQL